MSERNEVAIERARQAWEHWSGVMRRLFSDLPMLTLYCSYRNKLVLLGAYWVHEDIALNDNDRRTGP